VTVKLTVTDDQGRTDSADVIIGSATAVTSAPAQAGNTACIAAITSGPTPTPGGSTPPPTPPPTPQPSASSSGGSHHGGGSLELFTLGLLGLIAVQLVRRRRRAHFSRCI
jgi:hypothetical protein